MQLDLSAPALINAAGAALFALLGLAVLPFARRSPRAWIAGLTAASFGALYVVQNVVLDVDGSSAVLLGGVAAASFVTIVALTLDLAAPLPRRTRVGLAGFALALLVLWLGTGIALGDPALGQMRVDIGFIGTGRLGALADATLALEQTALAALVATIGCRLRATPAEAPRERAAYAALALAFAPFVVLLGALSGVAVASVPGTSPEIERFQRWNFAYSLACVVAVIPLLPAAGPRSVLERAAFLLPVATGLVGLIIALGGADPDAGFGAYGIARAVGAAFLAYGILRHDLLRVQLPRLAVKRGGLAMSALAVLFVVAQLAQNFFTARFGLVLGGVVAGTFLFAAQPLQRAFETISRPEGAPVRSAADGQAAEESYRLALRLALRDRALSREEERGLVVLAHDLGIPPRRAHELQDEVERALGKPR